LQIYGECAGDDAKRGRKTIARISKTRGEMIGILQNADNSTEREAKMQLVAKMRRATDSWLSPKYRIGLYVTRDVTNDKARIKELVVCNLRSAHDERVV